MPVGWQAILSEQEIQLTLVPISDLTNVGVGLFPDLGMRNRDVRFTPIGRDRLLGRLRPKIATGARMVGPRVLPNQIFESEQN